MFEYTGADGIMIGRASIGNPWIFEEVINYLTGKEQRMITNKEKLKQVLEKMNLDLNIRGEKLTLEQYAKLANLINQGI